MNVSFRLLGRTGRLGNSLWQLASTVGVARARGVEPRFNADWRYRPFLSVPDEWFVEDFAGCQELTACPEVAHLRAEAVYAQDYSLWEPYGSEIREIIAPSDRALGWLAACFQFNALARPILSVHVRRGDNAYDPNTEAKWRYHPLRPLRYYLAGMKFLAGASSVAVFGDDPDWNREHLPNADYYGRAPARVKEPEPGYDTEPVIDWVDLFLMARADRFVLSNSTFSWWAAWLSGSDDVVYPWPWFGPALAHIQPSRMFTGLAWHRIDHGPYDPSEVA